MATFKFNEQAKQIFLDVYNDPSVSSKDLPKAITEKLLKEGFLEEGQKISAKLCRVALEDKLGKKYVNRPRVKHESMIKFEDDEVNATDPEDVVMEQEYVRPEPTTFNF